MALAKSAILGGRLSQAGTTVGSEEMEDQVEGVAVATEVGVVEMEAEETLEASLAVVIAHGTMSSDSNSAIFTLAMFLMNRIMTLLI